MCVSLQPIFSFDISCGPHIIKTCISILCILAMTKTFNRCTWLWRCSCAFGQDYFLRGGSDAVVLTGRCRHVYSFSITAIPFSHLSAKILQGIQGPDLYKSWTLKRSFVSVLKWEVLRWELSCTKTTYIGKVYYCMKIDVCCGFGFTNPFEWYELLYSKLKKWNKVK